MPPEFLIVSPLAPSYGIWPTTIPGITITDSTPSETGYAVDVSYDGGVTWTPYTTVASAGANTLPSPDNWPAVVATTTTQIRVTNADTLATAATENFTLVADEIQITLNSLPVDTAAIIDLTYLSDRAPAAKTSGDETTPAAQADTDAGLQDSTATSSPNATQMRFDFASPLDPAGFLTVINAGDWTYDRPAAHFAVPQQVSLT